MSRGSIASARTPTQLPSQSAWAKGPPQNSNSTAPSPRSQSPAPSHVQSIGASHFRRTSALGQGVSIKEGVSVPRSNVGSARQGSSLNFGSIDDASAPVSSSPTTTPVVRNESVKSFGSLPATAPTSSLINGKSGSSAVPSRHSSRPMSTVMSASSASPSLASTYATPPTTSSTFATSSSMSSSAMPSTCIPSTTTAKSFNVAKLFQAVF
ncbi:hypothetical protein SCLCIDRAFT_482853 [Scleroderma citrinum Foug A]|uniref:Uncharacterized protein n=1 Tax=Scleroderma citrinum Foug A TaxID=1036808 RepID=A0A0C3CWD4_9AGAM|nr:hypothetical protein SCLCIDRAFT_482853 [Scleroderma citrinum Foug A]